MPELGPDFLLVGRPAGLLVGITTETERNNESDGRVRFALLSHDSIVLLVYIKYLFQIFLS